jgi:hypothetical protein
MNSTFLSLVQSAFVMYHQGKNMMINRILYSASVVTATQYRRLENSAVS